jgi:hypothetical protein
MDLIKIPSLSRRSSSVQSIEWEKIRSRIKRIVISDFSPHSSFQSSILTLAPDQLVIFGLTEKVASETDETVPVLREKYKFVTIVHNVAVFGNYPATNVTPRTKNGDKKIASGILQIGNLIMMIIVLHSDSISDVKKFLDENVIGKQIDIIIIQSTLNFAIDGFSTTPDVKSPFIHTSTSLKIKNSFTNLTYTMPKCIDITL